MNKIELLKEKLFVINEKLELESNFQDKTPVGSHEHRGSIEREIVLLKDKKSVIDEMSAEIESILNK